MSAARTSGFTGGRTATMSSGAAGRHRPSVSKRQAVGCVAEAGTSSSYLLAAQLEFLPCHGCAGISAIERRLITFIAA